MRTWLLAGGLLLAGCSTLPPADTPLPPRSALGAFTVEGRFALNSREPGQDAQQASGRLRWTQRSGERAEILLMTPLGHGVAEMELAPGASRLRTDDGREYRADDGERLLHEVTGQHLPLSRLADWLRGRGPVQESDVHGRPLQIAENGWQIRYSYDDETPEALPARLQLRHTGPALQVDLRLRLETWRTDP